MESYQTIFRHFPNSFLCVPIKKKINSKKSDNISDDDLPSSRVTKRIMGETDNYVKIYGGILCNEK